MKEKTSLYRVTTETVLVKEGQMFQTTDSD